MYIILILQMVAMESLDVTVMQNKLTDHGHQLSNLTLTLSQVQQRFGSFRTEIREVANNISKSPGPMVCSVICYFRDVYEENINNE